MLTDAVLEDYRRDTVDHAGTPGPLLPHDGNPEITKFSHGGLRSPAGGRPRKQPRAQPPVGPRWYVVEADPREIHAANRSIIDKGFDTFLPTIAVSVQGKLGRRVLHRPMFYQFLFARFDIDNEDWRAIRAGGEIPNGIKRVLLTSSQRPVPVERGLVEHLIATAADRLKLPPDAMPAFKPDEIVLVKAGVLEGRVATVVECDGVVTKLRVTAFGGRPCDVLVRRCDVSAE